MTNNINRFEHSSANNSVTTSESTVHDDLDKPYTLLEWIERTGATSGNADIHVHEYNKYLKLWRSTINHTEENDDQSIQGVYIRFLREVISIYSTSEEKRFIQTLDLRNAAEADTAIPIYTRRIREVINKIYNQRNLAKFQKIKHSLRGSKIGLEKLIMDSVINMPTA